MEPYIFFVFFSAIVLPTGEIKTLTHHVTECPSKEIVEQMHVPKLNRGEIRSDERRVGQERRARGCRAP